MIFEKQVLKKHRNSSIFAIVFMAVVCFFLLIEPDRFSILLLFPVCCIVFIAALRELVGTTYALKREGKYLLIEENEIVYFDYYGKALHRISKSDIVGIFKEDDFLKVYVKARRKLTFAERLKSICFEDQWNMYPLMLYGELSQTEICGREILAVPKEQQAKQYVGMSRYLFSFIFGCITWYLISSIFTQQSLYLLVLGIACIGAIIDFWFNSTNICDANWLQATIKCVVMGSTLAAYAAYASFGSEEIVIEERGLQLLSPEKVAIYLLIVVVAWMLLIFRRNLVTILCNKHRKIALYCLILATCMLMTACGKTEIYHTTDSSEYMQIEGHITNEDGKLRSGLFIFPENIDQYEEVEYDYWARHGFYDIDNQYMLFLKVTYPNANAYQEEVERLREITCSIELSEETVEKSIEYSETLFEYPAYVSIYNSNVTFEYALVDEDNNEVVYIYWEHCDDIERLDKKYRPLEFQEKNINYDFTWKNQNIYYAYDGFAYVEGY